MRLKELNPGGRIAVTLFALTLLASLASAEYLIFHSLGYDLSVAKVKAKYTGSLLVGVMWGSMYEYVTEDESVAIVERWVAGGATEEGYNKGVAQVMKEDCTNCHSKTSTMSEAMPSMPLTSYEDTLALTRRGLPPGKLLLQVHVHAFALATILAVLALMFSAADIFGVWKVLGPVVGYFGLWLDTAGWILGTIGEWAAWMIMIGGGLLAAAIAGMAVIIMIDCWAKVPIIGKSPGA